MRSTSGELAEPGPHRRLRPGGLHEALTRVINRIHQLGDAIHRSYFEVRITPPAPTETAEPLPQPSGRHETVTA